MPYTPPPGNALPLRLTGAYTPALGTAVPLAFGDGGEVVLLTASIETAQGQTLAATTRRTLAASVSTRQAQQPTADVRRVLALASHTQQGQTTDALATPALVASAHTAQGRQSVMASARGALLATASTRQAQRPSAAVKRFLPWFRGPAPAWRLPLRAATAQAREWSLPWDQGVQRDVVATLPIAPAQPRQAECAAPWRANAPRDAAADLPLRAAPQEAQAEVAAPWLSPTATDVQRALPIRRAPLAPQTETELAVSLMHARDAERLLPWGSGRPEQRELHLRVSLKGPLVRDLQWRLPWQQADVVPYGYTLRAPPSPPPPPAPHICYVPPEALLVPLRFTRSDYTPPGPLAVALDFVCRGIGRTPPFYALERSTVTTHTLTAVRLPDRLPLHITALAASIDADSLAWSFSLGFGSRADLLAVAPSPAGLTTVEISLNGHVWQALIERYRDERQFGRSGLSATGRSPVVQLLAPYAVAGSQVYDDTATASQIAGGLFAFSDFTVDWQAPDWTIPAGLFATRDDTPLSALGKLAASIQATVQATPDGSGVVVASRYPVSPWRWDDPETEVDLVLDGGSVISTGLDWQPGAGWQGIYVSGTEAGVLARVIRDGSNGEPFAQVIVEPLISAIEAATERGRIELAKAEDTQAITLLLPLFADPTPPGLVRPGRLLEVLDPVWGTYRALVESCAVEASREGDAVIVRQRLTVRRHLRESV